MKISLFLLSLPSDYILQYLLYSSPRTRRYPPRFYLDMQPSKLPIGGWDKVQIPLEITLLPFNNFGQGLKTERPQIIDLYLFLMISLISGSGLR